MWRQMGRWGSFWYTHDVHRRWGSVFWRSWARVIRGRLPVIGRPNANILSAVRGARAAAGL
jgi:hypothetical protein